VSKGEGDGVLPCCSNSMASRCSTAHLPHQGHRLLGAGHQGEVARRGRHRARLLLPERRRIAKEMAKQGLNVPVIGGACAGAPGFIEMRSGRGRLHSTAAFIDDPRPEVQLCEKDRRQDRRQAALLGPRAYDISIPTSTASRSRA